MELKVSVRFDETEGPRYTRQRISHLLGGLLGLNQVCSPDFTAPETARRVEHRLTGGDFLDLAFLDHALEVLDSMKVAALERSKPQWWRDVVEGDLADLPNDSAVQLAATFLQNADRIAEVIGLVKDLREQVVTAEAKIGIISAVANIQQELREANY